ncbi:TNT domain-containing protein [Actinokineospora sp. PR83]|uniref:glycohydrolase toxin TNT-related protein n=1 Tax=Actinokineospora sp. PR83 TaxID=2884908 RepID=UPI001F31ADEE|nr:glycohydrolase toxin TNT-related protein [Actinokineospora sp. PR83]MCG8919552.1 TNT domain-containing protein [Actinokineospora sp. PR83]
MTETEQAQPDHGQEPDWVPEFSHLASIDAEVRWAAPWEPGETAVLLRQDEPHDDPYERYHELPDGGGWYRVLELGRCQSLFTVSVTGADAAPVEVDPVAGHIAPAEAGGLVVHRTTFPIDYAKPHPPRTAALVPDEWTVGRPTPDRFAREALAAITDLLPHDRREATLECRAVVWCMEVEATVTTADGTRLDWAVPAAVTQWLHRLRMVTYTPDEGAWFTARLRWAPDAPVELDLDHRTEPAWRVAAVAADYAEELRLLPRKAAAAPPWLLARGMAVLPSAPRGPAGEHDASYVASGFDLDDGEVVGWYRPVLTDQETELVLGYLDAGRVLLHGRGDLPDLLAPGQPRTVPMTYQTDGCWVWSGTVAHYLREHGVPPRIELVDHIRANAHTPVPPVLVPERAMARGAALAMGAPRSEYTRRRDAAWDDAVRRLIDFAQEHRVSGLYYRFGEVVRGAWTLGPYGDEYSVFLTDPETGWRDHFHRFTSVHDAVAFLSGLLYERREQLRREPYGEMMPFEVPFGVLTDTDPGVQDLRDIRALPAPDSLVDRWGSPQGNVVYTVDVPFEERGHNQPREAMEYHRYRMRPGVEVISGLNAFGHRAHVFPVSVREAEGPPFRWVEEVSPDHRP